MFTEQITKIVTTGRICCNQIFINDPSQIILPLERSQYVHLLQQATYWQVAFSDFIGQIDNHFPNDLIFQFFLEHPCIIS